MDKGEHQNKKYSQKRMLAIINIVVITTIVAVVSVLLIVLERPTVSETENRALAKPPTFSIESFFSGEFTSGVSEFYNDTVPERDFFKSVAAAIRKNMGISVGGASVYGDLNVITTPPETPPPIVTEATAENTDPDNADVTTEATTTEAATTEPERNPANEIADGVYVNGQIVVYQDGHYRGISMYGGGSGANYADYVSSFAADLDGAAQVYSMVVPTSGAYYTPINFAEYNASHRDSLDSIAARLADNVIDVDAYSALEAHIDEEIYTRTDHHWQPLGAYYAVNEFLAAAGLPATDIDSYEKNVIDGYVGTLYSFTEDANLLNDPEQFVYYKPQNDYTCYYYDTAYNFDYQFPLFVEQPVSQSYSMFMGGDAKIVRIESDNKNGRKLAVLKDSYGNAEIPFLVGSFEEVYVIDIRYFDLNAVDFIKENGITDVLFSMCTFSAVGTNAENIEIIRTR